MNVRLFVFEMMEEEQLLQISGIQYPRSLHQTAFEQSPIYYCAQRSLIPSSRITLVAGKYGEWLLVTY